jgi:DNA polymerase-1
VVRSNDRFLIAATFIAEKEHKTFLGAPLLSAAGRNYTFEFGFIRDLLRLRREFQINAGLVIVGREVYSLAARRSVHSLMAILTELKIPHLHDPVNTSLHLVGHICNRFSHIITAERKCLQFCAEDLIVVLPRQCKGAKWNLMTPDTIKQTIGIAPADVPAYMALTDSSSGAALTSKQAARLIELNGTLDSIYANLEQIASAHVRIKLAEYEANIRQIYVKTKCNRTSSLAKRSSSKFSFDALDTATNRRILMGYGFHSLSVLLPTPSDVQSSFRDNAPASVTYHAVVDREGIQRLSSLVRSSKLCAIDTESDSKDPRTASLLGISFSVRAGTSYFVPLTAGHLKGLTRKDALGIVGQILSSGVAFVGHNIKYDDLLLRRFGAPIKYIYFDTMLAAYDCYGDWPFFSLPYVCRRLLDKALKSYSDTVTDGHTFLEMPLSEMVNHACQDADFALRLYPVLSAHLQERAIAEQFVSHTMKTLARLGNLEFDGIAIDVERIGRIRGNLTKQADQLRASICAAVGRMVELNSQRNISEVLREIARLRGYVAPNRITALTLEQLAASEPLAKQIVKFRRLRNRLARLECITASVCRGRIYPLFNQISSRSGIITSRPGLFGSEDSLELMSSFNRGVRDLFTDPQRSLQTLAEVTKDPILRRVTTRDSVGDPGETMHPLIQTLDHDDLLLRLAIGQSDTEIDRRFMIGRSGISAVRRVLEKRYQVMFEWLNTFRRLARENGYAEQFGLRKYIDGLRSSDLARREQALEYAVRWLIRY